MSTNCLRGLDDATQEEFRNLTPDRIVREHVSNIIKLYFEQQSVLTQAQILHGLIKHKKTKRATKLLGFKDVKNKNARENVAENVTTALSAFGKSRTNDSRDARRAITIAVVARSTSRNQMVTTMSKMLHVSRRTLHKYTKFRVKIDEKDEVACWPLICREAYQDKMEEGIREKVIEYWGNHSRAIPDRKHVL